MKKEKDLGLKIIDWLIAIFTVILIIEAACICYDNVSTALNDQYNVLYQEDNSND